MQLKKICALPRTLFLNLKIFGLREGLKMPLLISNQMRVGSVFRGCVKIKAPLQRFMIELGVDGSEGISANKGYFSVSRGAEVIFEGTAYFAEGTVLRVDGGTVKFGKNFTSNKNNVFWAEHGICFGENVLLGYDVYFRDGDGHKIVDAASGQADPAIRVGDHVWISSAAHVLKGVTIPSGCVVGYNSCLLKAFEEENCLIAGYPAKISKRNIHWEK